MDVHDQLELRCVNKMIIRVTNKMINRSILFLCLDGKRTNPADENTCNRVRISTLFKY